MGNPRLPTKTKVIRHTFRADRSPANEPQPELASGIPDPASGLPPEGRKLWKQLAPDLVQAGLLARADLPALEALCSAYALFRDARRAVYRFRDGDGKLRTRTLGEYLAGRNSQTAPELAAMRAALGLVRGYLSDFGLSPAARGRIDLAPAEREKSLVRRMMDAEV